MRRQKNIFFRRGRFIKEIRHWWVGEKCLELCCLGARSFSRATLALTIYVYFYIPNFFFHLQTRKCILSDGSATAAFQWNRLTIRNYLGLTEKFVYLWILCLFWISSWCISTLMENIGYRIIKCISIGNVPK